jgi:hypothetical protein
VVWIETWSRKSAVNQLPSLAPSFLTPLTRRIPAQRGRRSEGRNLTPRTPTCGRPRAEGNRPWGEMARFQMHPVTDDNRLAERQSRLRVVPVHEFINGMAIAALSVWAETVENGRSGDLEIWQSQDHFGDATLIFAGWLCLHHLWPPGATGSYCSRRMSPCVRVPHHTTAMGRQALR